MKTWLTAGVFALATITNANAFDITLGTQPGGGAQRTVDAITASFKEKNINIDVKYNKGCSIVKNAIENNNEKMVFITSAVMMNMPECALDFKKDNVKILDELYTYSYALCYQNTRSDLGLDNFLNPKVSKTIAATAYSKDDLALFASKLNLGDSAKIVNIGSTGKTRQAILGTEFDYVVIDTLFAADNADKLKCLFIGTDEDQKLGNATIPSMTKYIKAPKDQLLLQDVFIVVGANMSEAELNKVRDELKMVRNSDAWKKFVAEFGNASVTPQDKKFDLLHKPLSGN